MTIKDFINIAWRISNDIYMRDYERPNAVSVSRKIFDELAQEANSMVLFARNEQTAPDAQICGLKLFVDDDMPDDYYQIGYIDSFIRYFAKKQKKKEEG